MVDKSEKIKVLFLCEHNSARSQIAEAFLRQLGGEQFEVESAGLEVKPLNPLAIEVMKEIGIDISKKKAQSVFDLYRKGRRYHYVITVCDKSVAEKCPIFPNTLKQLHWPFEDPSKFNGSWDDKIKETRKIREEIKEKIEKWIENV
jgi:arsenate reductase (thioredoxin)